MGELSRRGFLKASALAGLTLSQISKGALAEQEEKSLVVEVRSQKWRSDAKQADAEIVRQMIDRGMMRLTSKSTPEAAWKALFSPGETVGVKFNRVSGDFTGANQAIVDVVSGGLLSAGLRKENIIVVEAIGAQFTGGTPQKGWAGEYDFGSGKTRLSRFVINQVDAIINVPNLKHHPLAGFTGCLKNISHAAGTLVEGPGRFHGNNCNPYIADIYAVEALRKKMRLQLLNGLKGIFDRGAYPPPAQYQWFHDGMFFSFDPVAVDAIGAELVDRARAEHGNRPRQRDQRALRYLQTAAKRGLGTNNRDLIELVSMEV